MNPVAIAILSYVTLERLFELWLSRRNTSALLAKGAREHAPGHYPLIVAVHVLWLGTLWALAPWRAADPFWLALYALLQVARAWVITSLGPRWTTRIIVPPERSLVAAGPYRLIRHPNYWVVVGEIAVLPLVFALPWAALVFTILNAAVLWVRIRAEDRALRR
jgi:methyltransferase